MNDTSEQHCKKTSTSMPGQATSEPPSEPASEPPSEPPSERPSPQASLPDQPLVMSLPPTQSFNASPPPLQGANDGQEEFVQASPLLLAALQGKKPVSAPTIREHVNEEIDKLLALGVQTLETQNHIDNDWVKLN